ncbi:DUF2514 family protein [Salmonella enterica subsp. enterica serovar Hull]|uniref:DUF2514 family protein n=1 Tax=Salmonella enterica subsp. enterica serovar Hull TaxID=1403564 RepID=A0A5X4PE16_SALET|nr:DUF2514 family protein [Citrobacter sedlakii]EAS2833379.1 DUF2514 domain-containing protein [Salmonella enterica]EBZ7585871.1 DUF2514 family protein [Salmonella enterica subsp. enterica serovar Hull]ECC3814900.1 DUF2514 family protein [Salmonella enterica subsp. enterica]ECF2938626.1 DUF2514 family protein [Salmonella enterica subsp. enterica serovar Reading]ECN6005606.1 DUF2514 family protein [Salmonella enterica subsp. enterica serovar Brandenburg]EDU6784113.1 DUF2514 family protein [Sal
MITVIKVILKRWWKPLAMILLVAFLLWRAGSWCWSQGYGKADAAWKTQWLQRDLADSTATLHREVAERAEEQRRQRAADEERKRADEELAKVQADADAAERARGGLQQQLAAVQRQLARSETGRLSALAAAGQAKAEAGILLAQLLSEADDLAGKFAKEADERYVAGSTCERTYNQVTGNASMEQTRN